jgi:hypothetical protein
MQMLQITPVMGYVAAHAQGMTIGPNILILPPLNPCMWPRKTPRSTC